MRQVRFEIIGSANCRDERKNVGLGYAAISDTACASGIQNSSTDSQKLVSYGIIMTVTENGGIEKVSFPDISFSKRKLRDFVAMLERNDVSPVHVEEMIDDFFYAG